MPDDHRFFLLATTVFCVYPQNSSRQTVTAVCRWKRKLHLPDAELVREEWLAGGGWWLSQPEEESLADNPLQKQPRAAGGRPFEKGQSGNPAGRSPGCRNSVTRMAEVMIEGEAEALTRRAIDLALEGNATALKLCLERIVPQRRSRTVEFDLPALERPQDLSSAIGAVLQGVASGRLFLDEGAALVGMMESKRKAIETADLEKRLQALERTGPRHDG